MTAQNTQGRGANAGPTTAPTNQDAVRDSEKLLEANTASIPDGPNVAPSPVEHLAAQGKLPTLSDGPNASNRATFAARPDLSQPFGRDRNAESYRRRPVTSPRA